MFEGDYTIYGKHATYIKYLKEAKIFSRYIDVYMAGAVLGALYEKRASQTDSSDRARIYADAFDTEHARCNEIFKIVILSDTLKSWSAEDRINICFRYRDRMDEMAVPPVTQNELDIMKEAKNSLMNMYLVELNSYMTVFQAMQLWIQRVLLTVRIKRYLISMI